GVALRRVVVHPGGERRDLLVAHLALVAEGLPLGRLPRRHAPGLHVFLDVAGPAGGLAVRHERARPHLAAPGGALAVLLQYGQHVAVVSDVAGRLALRLAREGAADGDRGRLRDRLAGEQLIEGDAQVLPRDLALLLEAIDVGVIDPAAIAQDEVR